MALKNSISFTNIMQCTVLFCTIRKWIKSKLCNISLGFFGKSYLFNTYTNECISAFCLVLEHLLWNNVHKRSTKPYALIHGPLRKNQTNSSLQEKIWVLNLWIFNVSYCIHYIHITFILFHIHLPTPTCLSSSCFYF